MLGSVDRSALDFSSDRARGRAHVTFASPHSDARDDARRHAPLPPFEVAGRIRAFSGFLRNFLDRAQGGLNPRLSALGASFGRLGPLDTPPPRSIKSSELVIWRPLVQLQCSRSKDAQQISGCDDSDHLHGLASSSSAHLIQRRASRQQRVTASSIAFAVRRSAPSFGRIPRRGADRTADRFPRALTSGSWKEPVFGRARMSLLLGESIRERQDRNSIRCFFSEIQQTNPSLAARWR